MHPRHLHRPLGGVHPTNILKTLLVTLAIVLQETLLKRLANELENIDNWQFLNSP